THPHRGMLTARYHTLPRTFRHLERGTPKSSTSFPTRRSSDLGEAERHQERAQVRVAQAELAVGVRGGRDLGRGVAGAVTAHAYRSEEHTSELQSRSDLVCRLLLEKKK